MAQETNRYDLFEQTQERPHLPSATWPAASSTPATAAPTSNDEARSYWIGGALALIIGFFVFTIPLSCVAIQLGKKAIEHGADKAGNIVRWLGWIQLILVVLLLVAGY